MPPLRLTTSDGTCLRISVNKTVCCVCKSSAVINVSDAPVFSKGCSVRVALTTMVSTVSAHAGAWDRNTSAAIGRILLCMTFSWLVPEAGTRRRRVVLNSKFVIIRAPRQRLHLSSRRFPPQSPSHPERKQDDGARQVSWLPGRRSLSAFPRLPPQWPLDSSLAGYSCGGSRGVTPRSLDQARYRNLSPLAVSRQTVGSGIS